MNKLPVERRRHKRLRIKIPIMVEGVDRAGQGFTESTETIDGSFAGIGFLLDHEPRASSFLVISIFHNLNLFHIRTNVCHVTPVDTRKLVGVKFRGIRNTSATSTNE
jgi:PilZ domain